MALLRQPGTVMKRTVIVGDVHGCIDELHALLREVGFDAKTDQLILAGDLVAKGPASQEVVHAARELGALGVRGNHDDHLLQWKSGAKVKLKDTHRQAAESLTDADWKYLAALPLSIRLPEHSTVVVHAGLLPSKTFEQQRAIDLMNLRSVTSTGEASYRVDDGVPWASLYAGPEFVVFGHDAIRGLQKFAHAWGLDSGCCYGRELTALLLPERRLVSVKARRAYAEVGRRPEY
jgi:hypothetical protein